MIQVLIDHWEVTTALVTAAFIVGIAWGVLKRDIKELTETIEENRDHMDHRFREMKENCSRQQGQCLQVHTAIEAAMEVHHRDDHKHVSAVERGLQQEWRTEMHKRFDRLEALILNRPHPPVA
jgi:hypothetical protein